MAAVADPARHAMCVFLADNLALLMQSTAEAIKGWRKPSPFAQPFYRTN